MFNRRKISASLLRKEIFKFGLICGFLIVAILWYSGVLQAQSVLKKLEPGKPIPSDLFVQLAKIVNPTVVNISTTQNVQNLLFPLDDPLFDFFFSPQVRPPKSRPVQSLGTGFIIRSNGLVVTNTHVINKANVINVQLRNSDKLYKAEVIGQDIYTDVALLKIKVNRNLPAAILGNSSRLQVGELVAAFGNPYGHGHTMTQGIISAVNRKIDELNLFPFLQTDASINPGNSGGPLVNTQGEVIGINTAMRTHGISFAIPIDNVKVILKDLETHGRVKRGFIGVQMAEYNPTKQEGAFIIDVTPGTPAEKAGVRKNDIIMKFNNKDIKNYRDLFYAVASTPINQTVPLEVFRGDQKISMYIRVVERQEALAKTRTQKPTQQEKQEAPFNLGLEMVTGTKRMLASMGLPPLNRSHPVVTKVQAGSPADLAGLKKRDILLKVNGQKVYSSADVQRKLSRNRTNLLNLLRYRTYSRQYVSMTFRLKSR